MATATNIDATAVNTMAWLSAADTSILVPVYQRQYRWDIGGCEQLLADIREVAGSADAHTHFIGSILSTSSSASDHLVLIDGQQRITTLMLLIAALHHTVLQHPDIPDSATIARELEDVLVIAHDRSHTKLRPHLAWAEVFESVVLDRERGAGETRDSRFDDNYAFFRSQVAPPEVPRIWAGLKRLEHVAITLGPQANAQQIFESLNSTGEPLRDHELIHNYVLMGLSHDEQTRIETGFWAPIEENTGDSIAAFWRHYLVMTTGREIDLEGGRGVYDAFRHRFPRLDFESLLNLAAEWAAYSAVYRVLLNPPLAADPEIARHLAYISTVGRGMFPLVMREYREHAAGTIDRAAVLRVLEAVQSLVFRRTVVGLGNERLVARLCRARALGAPELVAAIARITPSDERVRVALKFTDLPHAEYVLGRLSSVDTSELHVEHIFPLSPGDAWSGDGERAWADYPDDEQNSHRALAGSLGNLALLEAPLAERALDKSFPAKRSVYAQSAVATTKALADTDAWGTAAIAERTARLSADVLRVWAPAASASIDDDGLTPILDAKGRRGWPAGWQREFEYVEYCGEHWEVHDVHYLFDRVFKRLWADARAEVTSFSARRGGPIFDAQSWNGQWQALDESHFLYLGWDSKYMLGAVQGVLEEAGLASEVYVKYSYIGAAM